VRLAALAVALAATPAAFLQAHQAPSGAFAEAGGSQGPLLTACRYQRRTAEQDRQQEQAKAESDHDVARPVRIQLPMARAAFSGRIGITGPASSFFISFVKLSSRAAHWFPFP